MADNHDRLALTSRRNVIVFWTVIAILVPWLWLLGCSKIDAVGKDGTTPLTKAANNGDLDTIKELLKKGANINAGNEGGATALGQAALYGHINVVKFLMMKGADINAKNRDGWTPLICAASRGNDMVVKALLDKGADINLKTSDGKTAMMMAELSGHDNVVSLLINPGSGSSADKEVAKLKKEVADLKAAQRKQNDSAKPTYGADGSATQEGGRSIADIAEEERLRYKIRRQEACMYQCRKEFELLVSTGQRSEEQIEVLCKHKCGK